LAAQSSNQLRTMIKDVTTTLNKEFRRLNRWALGFLLLILGTQCAAFALLFGVYWRRAQPDWLPHLIVAGVVLLGGGVVMVYGLYRLRARLEAALTTSVGQELHHLRAANDRARSLQAMAATLSATLSFERVVEQALDVCSLALGQMGIPRDSLVGAVFLYDEETLTPLAKRRFLGLDEDRTLAGKSGVVGTALRQAAPAVTDNPAQDPELCAFAAFQECLTAVSVPLRAGFELFGVMVIGTDTAVQFDEDHFNLFSAVADQTVIALQNAQLYQRLEAEKQRLIEVDDAARKELARDLHDGPTQNVAAIAMRLSFLRKRVAEDPDWVAAELGKIQQLAEKTSHDIRGMLFTLRPLILETQGLGPAIETIMKRIQEADGGLEMRLVGGEYGGLLNKKAQGVVFAIIEEALSNARKYAQAGLVEVHMWQEDGLFVASISDNGVGFEPDDIARDYSVRGSLGLLNMRERAERIDGSVSVESAPDAGTTVTLVVPLDKHGRETGAGGE
jgi:signal transduction histidine kinase